MQSNGTAKQLLLSVNGQDHPVLAAANTTLLEVLREDIGLTGTKHGCELGECGACTVLVDDTPVLSCLTLAIEAEGAEVTTVEGLIDGDPHPIQEAFVEEGAAQCGYCTSGMLLTGKHLLELNDTLDREEIAAGISGNICRCTGYAKIISAIERAADEMGLRVETEEYAP